MILAILSVITMLSIRLSLGLENVRLKRLKQNRDMIWDQVKEQSLPKEQVAAIRQNLRVSLVEHRHFRHASPAAKGFAVAAGCGAFCIVCIWLDMMFGDTAPGGFGFFPDLSDLTGPQITRRILLVLYSLKAVLAAFSRGRLARPISLVTPLLAALVLPAMKQCVSLTVFSLWVTDLVWTLASLLILWILRTMPTAG